MELLNLHYFMAVGKYGNFTKAARATYTSQSNISKQIAALEEELGAELFRRTNTGTVFTPAGKRLYDGLGVLLPKLNTLFEEVSGISAASSAPTVRLGLCDTIDIERVLPNFLQKLNAENRDEVVVELEPCDVRSISERLAVGDIDCALMFNITGLSLPGLTRLPLNRANPCIYYSEKHPLASRPELTAADFENETFVHILSSDQFDQFEALPFRPKHIIEVTSLNTAFLYISTGQAVSVFGPSQNRLGRRDIYTIELPTEQKVGTDLVWLENGEKPALQKFLQLLLAAKNGLPG